MLRLKFGISNDVICGEFLTPAKRQVLRLVGGGGVWLEAFASSPPPRALILVLPAQNMAHQTLNKSSFMPDGVLNKLGHSRVLCKIMKVVKV